MQYTEHLSTLHLSWLELIVNLTESRITQGNGHLGMSAEDNLDYIS